MKLDIVISLMGGLCLFLYGMNLMAEGLEKSAGSRLKKIVELLTSNIFMGVLVGAFVTAIIQSSSATTVMVVGFVNAGIMNLTQAIGVIMGANIGTTITAQLVSFDLKGLAPVALGIGIILYLFASKPKTKNIAEILGDHPILGLLLGFGITAIVQSSSASMGMLIALASQGLIPLSAALPILYGQNIGTCVTSLISSVGASSNAKRAAVMHLIFNVLGTLVFLIFLNKPVVSIVTSMDQGDVARQLANTHTLFNIVSVIILLPFSKFIIKLAVKLVPEKHTEDDDHKAIKYLDERMVETPSIAVASTVKETLRMGKKAKESLTYAIDGFVEKSQEKVDKSFKREKTVNELQKGILNYLLKLSKANLDDDSRDIVDSLFNTVNDIERIGDHAENIAELAQDIINSDFKLSEQGTEEVKELYNKVIATYSYALEAMKNYDVDLACRVIKMEEQVDMMEKSCRANHMHRLNNNLCDIDTGVIFLDLISNLERVSDHAVNIAQQVIANKLDSK